MMASPTPNDLPGAPTGPQWEAQAFHQFIFQNAPQGIVILDAEGRALDANPAAQRLLGLSLAQIQGHAAIDPGWRLVLADGSPFPDGTLPGLAALRTGKAVSNAAMGVTGPGLERTRWLEVSANPVFLPGSGAPFRVFVSFVDITGRKEALDRLEASERKFARAFHASPDSVNINRLEDGAYLEVNEGFTRITGYTSEDVLGRSSLPGDLGIWVNEADRARLVESLRRDGLVERLEAQFRRKDGSILTGLMSASLIEVQGVPCVLTVTRDITERRLAEMRLRESEERYRAQFSLASEGIITHTFQGDLLEVNLAFARMHGYTPEEMARLNLSDFDVPGTRVMLTERVARIKAGEALTFEVEHLRKDGQVFPLEVSAGLINSGGKSVILAFHRDITERKRSEESLRESAQRLELAVTSGRLGIWEWNLADGRQIWNDRMYEIYGLEPRASHPDLEYWCRHIVHPEDLEATETVIRRALAGIQPYDLEFRAVRPDGTIRHVKSAAQVLRNHEGKAVRVIGVNQDQTREVEAEAERQRLQANLLHAEKLESIGSLAGGVAHDMNNVLAAIMGMTSVLRSACADDDPRARPLDIMTSACVRGRDVVKSLLYFARKDLETLGPVNLNAIALEVVQLLSYTTLKRIQITTDFLEPLDLIEGDAAALSHALVNLCVNAVDAMPGGGSLVLSTREAATGGVAISVRDTGRGMSPEVARRSIEPFFTTKPMGEGTGLGLAMVYGTVKAHRGTMEIRSEPGRGTEVLLAFPAAPRQAGREDPDGGPVVQDPGPEDPLRILLVDDDELIRASVTPMLAALGHEARSAKSGEEALAQVREGLDPDLVILDMNMPGLNGAQTLARLLELRPGQAVLMATGHSEEALAPLLKDRANVASLRKPFSLGELKQKLATLGGLARGRRRPPSG